MAYRRSSFIGVALALLVSTACDKKEGTAATAETAKPSDGGVPHSSAEDKSIAEAVAQVAQGSGGPGTPAGGPPENGVFAPGVADREMRPGDLPKIAVGSKGSGPTVHLVGGIPKAGKKFGARMQIALQMGPRAAMPTIELMFALDSPAASTDPAAPAGPSKVVARVVGAKPAAASEQPGELPPGTDKQIGKIKGSKVELDVGPNGGARVTAVTASPDMDEALGVLLRSASESLVLLFLPYPTDPVGADAYWMVTSRETFAGLDVLSYRMVKVASIEGDHASLGITTKRYVAGGQLGFQGIPPHHIEEFNGSATDQLIVTASDPTMLHADLDDQLLGNLTPDGQSAPPGQPGGHMQVHLEFRSKVATGI